MQHAFQGKSFSIKVTSNVQQWREYTFPGNTYIALRKNHTTTDLLKKICSIRRKPHCQGLLLRNVVNTRWRYSCHTFPCSVKARIILLYANTKHNCHIPKYNTTRSIYVIPVVRFPIPVTSLFILWKDYSPMKLILKQLWVTHKPTNY